MITNIPNTYSIVNAKRHGRLQNKNKKVTKGYNVVKDLIIKYSDITRKFSDFGKAFYYISI